MCSLERFLMYRVELKVQSFSICKVVCRISFLMYRVELKVIMRQEQYT